jgi:transcriptional regulator with GAF, ATPase, and Fis domain
MAAELFGYEKGAFTGAHQRHAGRFEVANHGTIGSARENRRHKGNF